MDSESTEVKRGFIDRSFREKIIIVGLDTGNEKDLSIAAQMTELERLVSTAGADVVHHLVQKRESPDPATFIGRGKVQEIYELAEMYDVDTVVFNDELSPAQQNNLEKAFKRSAIDRTAVILDIFAQNASTPEGKAQVELAQLQYLLPRLRGRGIALSQQGGGIGTRGPGETKLEVDRRRLVRKVHYLQKLNEFVCEEKSIKTKAKVCKPINCNSGLHQCGKINSFELPHSI